MATRFSHLTRPSFVRDEYLDYLDELFENYAVDVERARPILCSTFHLAEPEAEATLKFWTSSFGRRLTRR